MASESPSQTPLGKRKREDDKSGSSEDEDFAQSDESSEVSDDDEEMADIKIESDDEDSDGSDVDAHGKLEVSDVDEDESDGEDDDLDEDAYRESVESFPNLAIYDQAMKELELECGEKVKEIEAILTNSGCTSESVEEFKSQAKKLLTVPPTEPMMIGMLGNTGVGM
jgi:hypothetical protein